MAGEPAEGGAGGAAAPGTGGRAGSNVPPTGGVSGDALESPDGPPADAAADVAIRSDTAAPAAVDGAGATGNTQGPIAEGTIAFSQDFETNMDGFEPSPGSIPASRYTRVDDPLGKRGKVMQLVWMAGDTYKTSPNNKPRSCISNKGFEFALGSKVSYAWGYMITSVDINATFAQNIRPGGPMWMLEGHNDGDLIVRCGGTTALTKKLVPNRWYDFRVEVDYSASGYVMVYIDGEKVYERRDNLGFAPPKDGPAHWDGGIYNTELGISNNRTRTVYISNLSVGKK